MTTITLDANNQRKKLDFLKAGDVLYAHVRSTSTMKSGTVRYQYALQKRPDLTDDTLFESLEGLSNLTSGTSRQIAWIGEIYVQLVGAGDDPNVYVDIETGSNRDVRAW